jgi:hypothetical protein
MIQTSGLRNNFWRSLRKQRNQDSSEMSFWIIGFRELGFQCAGRRQEGGVTVNEMKKGDIPV